jgi:hypothetical protein
VLQRAVVWAQLLPVLPRDVVWALLLVLQRDVVEAQPLVLPRAVFWAQRPPAVLSEPRSRSRMRRNPPAAVVPARPRRP